MFYLTQLNKEIKELKVSAANHPRTPAEPCGHEEIILALQNRLSEVESLNAAVTIQNDQLQERLTEAYGVFHIKSNC